MDEYGVAVPKGEAVSYAMAAKEAAERLGNVVVVT